MTTLKIEGTVTEISSERWAAFEAFEKGNAKEWPRKGDQYWCLDSNGEADLADWIDDEIDVSRQSIGNIYRTESEALAQVEKLKAKARIDKYIRDNGLEFVPDWGNDQMSKHWIFYDTDESKFYPDGNWYEVQADTTYFASESHAQQVIDNCTDDLKTLFGI